MYGMREAEILSEIPGRRSETFQTLLIKQSPLFRVGITGVLLKFVSGSRQKEDELRSYQGPWFLLREDSRFAVREDKANRPRDSETRDS